jgi:hypothetical protein
MAKRAKNRKTNVEGPRESGVLERLDAADSAGITAGWRLGSCRVARSESLAA